MTDDKMNRAEEVLSSSGEIEGYIIWCPGCEQSHMFTAEAKGGWKFNGDLNRPTFTPSLLCNKSWPERRCHSFVADGKIKFLSDCFHKLAGQTVELDEARLW